MDFTIYTTGSAEFLEIMLNACAMVVGSGDAEDLARIGALLGLLLLGFQAVFNNQAIGFQKAGLVLALYMMFYGPTATTVIEDTTSGQVRVVDNVPLGPAFVGSVISTVAYSITKTSEQAFSTPAMTTYGLFSSLSTLSKVRDALRNPMSLDAFQNHKKGQGWDLPRSVNEYMTYCLLNPVTLRNNKTMTELYRSPGWKDLMSSQSSWMSMYVYNGQGAEKRELMSCKDAQGVINNELSGVIQDIMDDIVQKGFAEEAKSNRITTGTQVEQVTGDAIQSLAMSGKSAQDYVTTSMIAPIFANSRVDALNHWQEQRAALALQESLNHQEIQWAGKGDSFKHYMRPMIAFFEGMLYAMTPFMAFALLLGGPGLSILGKYLVLPLAVGLWMPLLSIVNAFTLWYAGSQMDAVFNGYDPTSEGFALLQLQDIDKVIGKALGIGGLLAASVPPLALFIVSGSAMVANSVMSQMTSAEKFRSEDVLPRAQQSSAVLGTQTAHTASAMAAGVERTGAVDLGETISGQQTYSSAVQSASTASQTAASEYQSNLSAASQEMVSTASGREGLAQIGNTLRASDTFSQNAAFNQQVENMRGKGWSEQAINTVVAQSAMTGQVGFDSKFFGGVMMSMKTTDGKTLADMSASRREEAKKDVAQLVSAMSSSNTKDLAFASGEAFRDSDIAQKNVSNTDQIAHTRNTALQAQENYSRLAAQQNSVGVSQNLRLRDAGLVALSRGITEGMSKEDQAKMREQSSYALQELAGNTLQGQELHKQAMSSPSIRQMTGDISERRAMAAIRTLNMQGRLGELAQSRFNPFDFSIDPGNAMRNAPVVEAAAKATAGNEQLQAVFGEKRQQNAENYAQHLDMNQSGMEAAQDQGPLLIAQRNEENRQNVQLQYQKDAAGVRAMGDQEAAQSVTTAGKNYPNKGYMLKLGSEVQGLQATFHDLLNDAQGKGGQQFQADFREGQQLGLTDSQSALRAMTRSGMKGETALYKWASSNVYSEAMRGSDNNEDYARGVYASLTHQAEGGGGLSADRSVVETIAAANRHYVPAAGAPTAQLHMDSESQPSYAPGKAPGGAGSQEAQAQPRSDVAEPRHASGQAQGNADRPTGPAADAGQAQAPAPNAFHYPPRSPVAPTAPGVATTPLPLPKQPPGPPRKPNGIDAQ